MKYQPREMGEAAEVSSGGGRRGTLKELVQLTLLSALVIIIIWLAVGGVAEIAVRWVTPKQEAEWLEGLLPELELWEPKSAADRERKELLEQVLAKLSAHPEVPQIPFRIILIDDASPNAFAIPGGVIGVTRGLLTALGDEEIAHAFVIGHELGHFKQRDHLRGIIRNLGTGTAVGLIFGSSGGATLAGNVNEMMQLDYSRDQEESADAFALRLVESAYGRTAGSERLFEKLQETQALPDWAYMFSTHPDTAARIRKIRGE
jgi:Zn-dependent protease with chaperone function